MLFKNIYLVRNDYSQQSQWSQYIYMDILEEEW